MKLIDALPPYLLAAAAIICFCMAVRFFLRESLRTAGALSALFFLCVVLAYLPQAESINAFAVNVKLKKNVDLAKENIKQLEELSKLNAKLAYTTLAWGNRLGSPTAQDKKALLDQVEQQLETLHVSNAERKEIARPLVRLIGLDLYFSFVHTMDRYVNVRDRDYAELLKQRPDDQAIKDENQKYVFAVSDWRRQLDHPEQDIDGYNLRAALYRASPTTWVSEKDAAAARKSADEIQSLFDDCAKEGGYTLATAKFLDHYSDTKGNNDRLKELFGRGFD